MVAVTSCSTSPLPTAPLRGGATFPSRWKDTYTWSRQGRSSGRWRGVSSLYPMGTISLWSTFAIGVPG